jgi:hypothetical protein
VKNLSLILHLERLPQNDTSNGTKLCYSLNFSAAFDSDEALTADEVKRLVQPWTWKIDPVLSVAALKSDGTIKLVSGELKLMSAPQPGPNEPDPARWSGTLAARLNALAKDPNLDGDEKKNPFIWIPPALGKAEGRERVVEYVDETGVTTAPAASQTKWQAELMHYSTHPAPLPQVAQLCAFVFVKAADVAGFDAILAAPKITFSDGSVRAPVDPTQQDILDGLGGGNLAPVRWKYDAGADGASPLFAWLVRAAIPVSDDEPEFLRTGWIPLKKEHFFAEDWLSVMDTKAADLFDLPHLILEFLGTEVSEADLPARAAQLWDLAHLTLRDLAQSGASCAVRVAPGRTPRPSSAVVTLDNEHGMAGDVMRELCILEGRPQGFAAEVAPFLAALEAMELAVTWETWLGNLLGGDATFLPPPAGEPGKPRSIYAVLAQRDAVLANEERLHTLLLMQWTSLSHPFLTTARQRRLREEVLPAFQIKKRLGSMHLGVVWKDVTAGKFGDEEIKDKLFAALALYFDERCARENAKNTRFIGYKPAFPALDSAGAPKPPDEDTRNKFKEWLKKHVDAFVADTLLKMRQSIDTLPPGQAADGLVLQVAELAGSRDNDDQDPADHTRRFSGVGCLLKRENGALCCLNFADLYSGKFKNEDPFITETELFAARAALVPTRLPYRNEMRQSLIVYQNQPLCALSPTAGLAQNHAAVAGGAASPGDELVRYRNAYRPTADGMAEAVLLPALRFGGKYQAAAFAIGLAGNLPKALHVSGQPAVPKKLSAVKIADVPMADYTYRRRAGIGPLRVEALTDKNTTIDRRDLKLPAIPATVLPITRSLVAFAAQADFDHSGLAKSTDSLAQSLVLLTPADDKGRWNRRLAPAQFEFQVRPPSADLRLWDRSFDFKGPGVDDRTAAQRAKVWQEFHAGIDSPRPKAETDTSLDDPAVEGLVARLTRLFGDSDVPAENTLFLEFPAATDPSGLKAERRGPVKITMKAGASPALKAGGAAIEVRVPKGEVWRLELFAAILPPREVEFSTEVLKQIAPERFDTHLLAAPRNFFIEVATEVMPAAADLHQALRPGLEVGNLAKINVELSPAKGARNFEWLHRVTVFYQRWRWNGRPLDEELPSDALARAATQDTANPAPETDGRFSQAAFFRAVREDSLDELGERWDGLLFGDRAAGDATQRDATVDFLKAGVTLRPPHSVFRYDATGDTAALYYRFALRAYSRYEGLLELAPVDSRTRLGPKSFTSEESDPGESWRRLVLLCRFHAELPPPRVKMVLPLTDVILPTAAPVQGEGAPLQSLPTPGLLVVLSEPWFRYGGLAEEFIAEAGTAREPDGNAINQPPIRVELGSDPIVAERGPVILPDDPEPPVPAGSVTLAAVPAIGPIGHTFDTDTLAPEFIHTSYVIPAPAIFPDHVGADGAWPVGKDFSRGLSWFFIKLQFRRRLLPDGMISPPTDTRSSPTPPVWSQFLPPSSCFALRTGGFVSTASLWIRRATTNKRDRWQFVRAASNPPDAVVELISTPADPPGTYDRRFQLRVLVTERLFDVYGRLTQERFVDICRLDEQGGLLASKGNEDWLKENSSKRPDRLRVRLLEFQVRPSVVVEETIDTWSSFLFPEDTQTEAMARIVRVSPPMEDGPPPPEE